MNKKGFTLMELLIVVVIITIFAAVTYPSYRSSIERARASEAVTMVGTIKAAELKHYSNYEDWGKTFKDINDFEPAVRGFDPSLNTFDTDFFRYTIHANTGERTYIEAVRINGNDSYSLRAFLTEKFIRCIYNDNNGEKVCSSLTDAEKIGNYYPIY